MLKIMGAAAITAAFFLYGRVIIDKRRQRLCYIENMITSVERFKSAVASKTPLERALKESGIERDKALGGEDFNALECFFSGIDVETESGVIEAAQIFTAKLIKDGESEKEKCKKEARLINGGSVALGVLVCILLI